MTEPSERRTRRIPRLGPGFWLKLLGLGIVDAVVVALIPTFIDSGATVALISVIIGGVGINYIFLSTRTYPLRWLAPGTVFLAILMIWPIVFTVFIALTNWSTGNFLEREQAIDQIVGREVITPEDPPTLDMLLYREPDGTVTMLVRDQRTEIVYYGEPRLRSEEAPEEPNLIDLEDTEVVDTDGDGLPEQIDDAVRLRLAEISGVPNVDPFVLDIPLGEAHVRTLPTIGAGTAVLALSRFVYDDSTDVLFDRLNEVPCEEAEGRFVCDGQRIDPGWRIFVGLENFANVITDERFRDPFLRVFIWNVIFAVVVVAVQFGLGLILALAFQEPKMRWRRLYRSLLIIPYAAPGFITIIVWRGLLNRSFGPVNRAVESVASGFGLWDAEVLIPWLTDPFWAKVAVILVTLWQGFPYFFLISTGALQSIPDELLEAARVDGASAFAVFRKITFPLLMVSVAPLLIASFSFNFNNFVNVFLLTAGGPAIQGYAVPVGETDLLITFTFNLAVESGRGQLFGLAAALTFFIFFLVATMSAISFRFTRRLEQIYGNL